MRQQRPGRQLTLPMLGWLVLDVLGMAASAAGLLHLVHGVALFGRWPASTLEAIVFFLAGAGAMVVGVANVLRLMLRVPADPAATRALGE